ncbi:MAG: DUF4339 domain-containing protein [Pseudomonadota bacterium]
MSGRTWFVAVGEKQEGPFSEDQLRDLIARGNVRSDTYVWADGMAAWQYAGDIPGLLSSHSAAPPIPRPGATANGGQNSQAGDSFSIEFGIWEMLGRALVFLIGFLLVIPAPWVAASFYRWIVSRTQVPRRPNLGFTGKPLDIWYVFIALALMTYTGLIDIPYLGYILFPVQAFLSWLTVRWITTNISSNGQPLALSFNGSPWTYIGWYILMALSTITIIGWAWVLTAWLRWICHNISGTRRDISFNASGWETLWRTVVFSLGVVLIIPIPWIMRWYGRWYVSQFSASERRA